MLLIPWKSGGGGSGISSQNVIYARGKLVYAGTNKGLFRSNDNGLRWQKLTIATGLRDSIVNALAVAPQEPQQFYLSIGQISLEYNTSNLYKSTDGGDSWKSILDSTVTEKGASVADVKVSVLNPNLVLALHRAPGPGAGNLDRIFRSTNGGLTWMDVSSNSFAISSHSVRIYLGLDRTDSARLYATGDTQFDVTFYVSESGGLTWIPKSTPNIGTSRGILSLGGDLIYLVGAWAAIYISTDGGSSWLSDNGINNSDRYLYKLAIHPDNRAIIIAATSDGLWVKNLVSGSWSRISGLPTGEYYDVFVDSTTGVIYAGGKLGLFRTSGITAVPELPNELPVRFKLFQNYPNPFNSQTVIEFEIPQRESIRLEVFNSLGQKVAVLFDGPIEPGNHKTVFNAAGLPSGLYFYRLQHSRSAITKPMLFLK